MPPSSLHLPPLNPSTPSTPILPSPGMSSLTPPSNTHYPPGIGIAHFHSWLHLLSPQSVSFGSTWWIRSTYWYFGCYPLSLSVSTWTLPVTFVLTSHIITMPLHVQITLPHWGMSTANLGMASPFRSINRALQWMWSVLGNWTLFKEASSSR